MVKVCNREKIQYGKCSAYGNITVGLNTRYTMNLFKTCDTFCLRMHNKDFQSYICYTLEAKRVEGTKL